MKQFFLDILNNLDKLAGLRQIEKIYSQHTDQNAAKAEINALLTVLDNVCQQFPYIPDDEKKRLINHAVITDSEFTSLNARIVYKWLSVHKDKYYKEAAHIEDIDPDWKPVPKDSPAYQEYLNQWLAALKPMEERLNVTAEKSERKILGYERPAGENLKHENGLTKRDVELQASIRRIAGAKYKDKDTSKFKNFTVDKINVFAASLEDARDIYMEAESEFL